MSIKEQKEKLIEGLKNDDLIITKKSFNAIMEKLTESIIGVVEQDVASGFVVEGEYLDDEDEETPVEEKKDDTEDEDEDEDEKNKRKNALEEFKAQRVKNPKVKAITEDDENEDDDEDEDEDDLKENPVIGAVAGAVAGKAIDKLKESLVAQAINLLSEADSAVADSSGDDDEDKTEDEDKDPKTNKASRTNGVAQQKRGGK